MDLKKTDGQVKECVIITGMSGAGKSVALRIFEDEGFFTIDNLPPQLLPQLLDILKNHPSARKYGVCTVIDTRGGALLSDLLRVTKQLKQVVPLKLLFMEADTPVLIRRFKETRRKHPLAWDISLEEGINKERKILMPIREIVDKVIDTSNKTIYQLREEIRSFINIEGRKLFLTFISFGFKYGLPQDIDLLFDVRFLPNPYYKDDLKSLDGTHQAVAKFLKESSNTEETIKRIYDLLEFLLPLYEKEGKSYLSVGIGCTGGKHRSVYVVEELAKRFKKTGRLCRIIHRDVDKEVYSV